MASLRFGVEWIAENDEGAEIRVEIVANFISVLLLADLFDKSPEDIAQRVVHIRRKRLPVDSN